MRYTSDLTDSQWELIKEYFPAGNKSKYDKRDGECSIISCKNRLPVEKSAKGFSKLEGSIHVLLQSLKKWRLV